MEPLNPLLEDDEDLDALRAMYRERMRRMNSAQGDGVVPGLIAGGIDALASGYGGQARADAILTGQNITPMGSPGAVANLDKQSALRRQKALDDVGVFKALEDIARRKQERAENLDQKEKDRVLREQYYQASLGDKEAQRQFMEALTGKKLGIQQEQFKSKLDFEADQKEKDRVQREALARAGLAAKSARGGPGGLNQKDIERQTQALSKSLGTFGDGSINWQKAWDSARAI
jgi:hypothetical protein